MLVIGDKEMENDSVSIRSYGAKFATSISTEELKENFANLNLDRMPEALRK
jgi:threonyl-tRNA synthetase